MLFDNLTVVFDFDGVLVDDVKAEIEKFIPKSMNGHRNLYGAAYSILFIIGEITLFGKKKIEEKLITRENAYEINAEIIKAVELALESGAKVRILTANNMIDWISTVLEDEMDARGIERSRENFVVEYCETRKKPMYVKKLQEEELKARRHVVFLDDSRVLPLFEQMLFLGTRREEKPDFVLTQGNFMYRKICTTVECKAESINAELIKIARRNMCDQSKESPKSRAV